MTDDLSSASEPDPAGGEPARLPREPVLRQAEIDAITGYSEPPRLPPPASLRAMVDGRAAPREPLPMLRIVLEGLVARLSLGLRGTFGDAITVGLAALNPVRYGDFLDDLTLPAQMVTFRAEGWDGSGAVAIGPDLGSLVLDVLLGAPREAGSARAASRPFSAIETAILSRLVETVLREAAAGFSELAPVRFAVDKVESEPHLAGIAKPGEGVWAAELSFGLHGRSGSLNLVLPFATLEPIRPLLAQSFAGVKAGRDSPWTNHLAAQVWQASLETETVLHETAMPLRRVLDLGIGDTLMFDMKPTDLVAVRSGGLTLTRGRIGRVDGRIAVQIVERVRAGARVPEAAEP